MGEEEISTKKQRSGFGLAIWSMFVGGAMAIMALHEDFSAWWWIGPPVAIANALAIGWKAQIGREVDPDRP